MEYSREDKLRISNKIVASEEWKMFEHELKDLIDKKQKELEGYLYEANTHKSFLHQGIKIGLEIALGIPVKMQRENQKFFDRLYDKITQ